MYINQAITAAFSDMIGRDAFELIHETGGALLILGGHPQLGMGQIHISQ